MSFNEVHRGAEEKKKKKKGEEATVKTKELDHYREHSMLILPIRKKAGQWSIA